VIKHFGIKGAEPQHGIFYIQHVCLFASWSSTK
jgi:hypothetical protein